MAAGMKNDFTLWTVDDEEVVTSGLGHEVSSGTYGRITRTIKHQNNKDFLDRYQKRYGSDALMNTVGVGMYNAAIKGQWQLKKLEKLIQVPSARR